MIELMYGRPGVVVDPCQRPQVRELFYTWSDHLIFSSHVVKTLRDSAVGRSFILLAMKNYRSMPFGIRTALYPVI
jgi:hypothetical protein